MFDKLRKIWSRRNADDFGDGDEGFNLGDVALDDVDPAKLEKLAVLFDAVQDRESAIEALKQVHGKKLVVL